MKTIELNDYSFSVKIENDDCADYPWDNDCIFEGVVSDWTTRDKKPSEKILNSDRNSRRYFDVVQYMKVAKAHGCTPIQAHEQCENSFNHLRRWCNDQWNYVGVIVTLLDGDGTENHDYVQSLWGVESDQDGYINDTANELAYQCIYDYEKHTAQKPLREIQ